MARSPVITATIQLENKVAAVLKNVESEVLRVTKAGNIDAAQLASAFAQAARKASAEIGQAGAAIESDFAKIRDGARNTGNEIGNTGGKAKNLKNELKDAAAKGALLEKTLKGLSATALTMGTAFAGALGRGFEDVQEYEKALALIRAQGATDDQMKAAVDQTRDLAHRYPAVVQGTIMHDRAIAIGSFGEENADRVTDTMTKSRAALIKSGVDPEGADQLLKTFENTYGNALRGGKNPVTGELTPTFEAFMDQRIRTLQSLGGLVKPEEFKSFQNRAKVAGLDMDEGAAAMVAGMLADEGGNIAGTSLMTLSSSVIAGHMTKAGREIMATDFKLFNPKDLEQGPQPGEFIPKAGAKIAGYEDFKRNPIKFWHDTIQKYIDAGHTQEQAEIKVQQSLPRTAADTVIKSYRQWESLNGRVERTNKSGGLSMADDQSDFGAFLDAEGRKRNADINLQAGGYKDTAKANETFSKAVEHFDTAVSKIPGGSAVASGVGALANSPLAQTVLGLGTVLGAKGIIDAIVGKVKAAPLNAARAAAAEGAAAGAEGAGLAAGGEIAAGGAAAAGGIALAPELLAGLAVLGAGAGVGWLYQQFSNDQRFKSLNAKKPGSLSPDDLQFMQSYAKRQIGEEEAALANISIRNNEAPILYEKRVEEHRRRLADLKAGFAKVEAEEKVRAGGRSGVALPETAKVVTPNAAPPVQPRAAHGAAEGQGRGLAGKGNAGASPPPLAALAVQKVDVTGKAEVTTRLQVDLSPDAKKLLAQPPPSQQQIGVNLSRGPFDKPQSNIRK